jgi:imidazolonepropionase-like amidohydrolase
VLLRFDGAANLGSEIGTIAPRMAADIVAMRGDYLADATAQHQMTFVMKGGRNFKYQP